MENIKLARELVADGFAHPELARLTHQGELIRVRRGAYVDGPTASADARENHLQLIAATVGQLARPATVSHVSAAALYGLPVWKDTLERVHLTRAGAKGRVRRYVHLHQAQLSEDEMSSVDGMSVTSLARTVVDVGRSNGLMRSVPVADLALSRGLPKAEVISILASHRCLHGTGKGAAHAHVGRRT